MVTDTKTIILTHPKGLSKQALTAAQKRLNAALVKAQEGDPTELNRLYDELPGAAQEFGKAILEAEEGILKLWGSLGKAPALYLDELRENLGYDVSGGLERLLIDRIVVCWLRVQQAEHLQTARDSEGSSFAASRYYDRRLEMANKTFLRACKTLAQIRKLMKRDIAQINIAQQQVNIATEDRPEC